MPQTYELYAKIYTIINKGSTHEKASIKSILDIKIFNEYFSENHICRLF